MKNLSFLFILFLVSSLLMTCAEQEFTKSVTISDKKISQEDITLKINNDGTILLDKASQNIFLKYINQSFKSRLDPSNKAETINSLRIEDVVNPDIETKNLIFDLSNDKEEKAPPFAMVLTANSLKHNASISFFSDIEHECISAPCNCCSFITHPGTKAILGCSCGLAIVCPAGNGDRCNHSIKTVQRN